MIEVHRANRRRARVATAGLAVALVVAMLPIPVAGAVIPPPADADRPVPEQADYVAGELLVRFQPGTSTGERANVRARQNLEKIRDLPLDGLELVRTRGQGTPPQRAQQAQAERAVRYAEPNFLWYPASVTPDDPEYPELWGLHNTGQTGGTADADIDAPEAWAVTPDTSGITVAVIDTGVWLDHPDLAANAWVNADEIPDNSIDDDENGYVDDVHGWDFFNNDNTVFDEVDGDDHGTHVAGTIAAAANNGTDVVGVSQAKVMALKFLGPAGGDTAAAVLALDYAIDNGAQITNNSWGGGGASTALSDMIAEADTAGVLFVAAAGNDGDDNDVMPHYPSNYTHPNVISVAATDDDDGLAGFSNYGDVSVDLGAPGDSILSTVPQFGKGVLVGPDTDPSVGYHSALHSIGLEGVPDPADRQALLGAALMWMGTTTTDPVLVVEDDLSASHLSTYTDTLGVSGLGYTNVSTYVVATTGAPQDRRGPTVAQMSGNTVIWFTGADFSSTLSPDETTDLQTFLGAGGKLILFGIDIAFDLTDDRATTNTFLRDWLRTDYVADYDVNYRPRGMPLTPYASVPTVELQTGSTPPGQFWSDALAPRAGAVAALRGAPTTWFGGTSMATPHVTGAAAVVMAGHPTISHLDVRSRLIDNGDALDSLTGKTVSGKRLNLVGALDTAGAPVISGVSASPDPFSPDGDGIEDTTTIVWTQNEPGAVNVSVVESGSITPVRSVELGSKASGPHEWTWDGRNDTGEVLSGSFTVVVEINDAALQSSSAGTAVTVGSTERPSAIADFDGNGTTDLAIFRPTNGTWYIHGQQTTKWGTNGDIPTSAPPSMRFESAS